MNTKATVYCILLIICFFVFPSIVEAKYISEDFNDGDLSNWITVADPDRNHCTSPWTVLNGRLDININQPSCTTNLIPSDEFWNDIGDYYEIEVDAWFVSGQDHAIAFRFVPDEIKNQWYDFHFLSPNQIFLERVPVGSSGSSAVTYPVPNRPEPYKLKIIVDIGNIQLYIDGEKVIDYHYNPDLEVFKTGKFAFRAGTGSNPISRTQFDNLIIRSLYPKTLDVPHFSQRDPQWSSVEYDNASVWQPNASWRQIEDIGCALTSGAMVLNYNGYTHSTETELLNPETLNTYLKERDGFNEVGGVNWVTMSRFPVFANTQDYYSDKNLPLLELSFKDFSLDTLKSELEQKLPVILKLRKDDNTHFVVAKAVEDENIYINDPLDLTDTDALLQERYADRTVEYMLTFTPSFTDLSYIWMNIYDPNVKVLVEHNGLKLGKDAEGNEYREIPGGNIFIEHPIAVAPELEEAGTGTYKLLMIPKPESGNYTITFHSENTSESSFDILGYDIDADNSVSKHQLSLTPGGIQQFSLNFDKQNSENNVIQEEISFELVRANLEALYTSGEISHHSTSNQLNALLNNAERIYPKNKKPVFNHLNQMLDIIDKKTPKTISHQANQLLSHLLQLLILHLQTS